MAGTGGDRACGRLAMVAALVVAAVGGRSAGADEPPADAPNRPSAAAARAEAREIFRALQELSAAVQKVDEAAAESSGSVAEALKALGRPEKTTRQSTLTPATIDAMIEKTLSEAKVVPARPVGDGEFVRRVYLDVTGKLPTPEQVIGFVRSKDKAKRAELIDRLLAGPEYARNWAGYWREVIQFRATAAQPRLVNFPKLEEWLAERFAENAPWDEIAGTLIAATGSTEDDGATIFTAAHQGQPVEVAGEVSRIFLGVQIQCAQCHDHPSDPWKREQFHEFAAFFAGVRARRNAKAGLEIVAQPGVPRYTMPDLKDPQKSIPVRPKFFLAEAGSAPPPRLTAQQRRLLAASYVTGQDNPWFAKAFVNRVVYVLMGEAFYNPIDDLGPGREPHDPEVLDLLASEWQEGGYDVRWLFRTILNTKAYQRQFRPAHTPSGRTPFAANCPSRLRADQILDALVQALELPLDGPGRRGMGESAQGPLAGPRGRLNPRAVFNVLFGVDPSTPSDEVLGTIPQALFLMNSPQIHRAIRADRGTVLGEILSATPDNRQALEALYLRVLARRPNGDEVRTCGRYLASVGNRREAFEDILWALVNSTEFLNRR